jgi:DNA-binding FrmR family transcriptional regulator
MDTPHLGGDEVGVIAVDETTHDILQRLKSIEGHVRGIQRMVESEQYCIDIVNQVLAVQRALQKVNHIVLDRHLRTCVTSAIRGQDSAERERVIAEIMNLFEAGGKG